MGCMDLIYVYIYILFFVNIVYIYTHIFIGTYCIENGICMDLWG